MFCSISLSHIGPKTVYVTVQNFGQDLNEVKRITQRIALKISAKGKRDLAITQKISIEITH